MPKCSKPSQANRKRQVTSENAARELAKTVKKLMGLRRTLPALEHISLVPTPSFQAGKDLIELARLLLFPGFFSPRPVTELNFEYHTGQILYVFYERLSREVAASIRHDCRRYNFPCLDCERQGEEIAMAVVRQLPWMREILATDIDAARCGDPAAGAHYDQIIFCYPGLFAITVQRLAHELYVRQVPFLPRILTEYAHARTGIDIHPGAEIGPSFFIDHGTGVVIGETTRIGARVRLYQGVTLGALSLSKAAAAKLAGSKRHPTLEDDVIVYSGATILGGDTVIGAGSTVGGNVWLTESIPPGTKVLIKAPELIVVDKSGHTLPAGPNGRPKAKKTKAAAGGQKKKKTISA
jgi:serine O-acetyltransferase